MAKVKITIEELEILVNRLKCEVEHGSMKPYVIVGEGVYPNGRKCIQFEQPCGYAECNSHCTTFDEQK